FLDVGHFKMFAECVSVLPYLVNNKKIGIGTVPVNMKLKSAWFGSGFWDIRKHPFFVGVCLARFRPMLSDDTIRARFARCGLRQSREGDGTFLILSVTRL